MWYAFLFVLILLGTHFQTSTATRKTHRRRSFLKQHTHVALLPTVRERVSSKLSASFPRTCWSIVDFKTKFLSLHKARATAAQLYFAAIRIQLTAYASMAVEAMFSMQPSTNTPRFSDSLICKGGVDAGSRRSNTCSL